MIDFTIDSKVTRISISPITNDADDLDEDEEPISTRLLTIETADGTFRLELVADDDESLEIEED